MDDFNTIRLKRKTIDKFKKYSKKTSPSYSETLDFMIAFFEDNHLSPYDTLRTGTTSLSNILDKRMDAIVSILKNVEETQLKPTKKMLESLFEEVEDMQPLKTEKKDFPEPKLITEKEELTYYRDAYFKKQTELHELKHRFKDMVEKFKPVKHTFSTNSYVMKITEQEYMALKNGMA
ncbi:hypothetical protein CJ739_3077 [Mariniflexile rhizosphaerae]|uniref:BfmA/BtgA family mobilization protein n=1 Tax=unclassified Mariniflexile TaxID=2643887 RepID=UPI000CA9710A|nr:BfmA/BtgA family mobilization protein [Mariniflexile sp. TRM1-10]AXP82139.1 hypothetical protein CJ739_3077 [Mariniflexile sp. TRM1-10]PLB20216.1 MAG: hypothetical protein TRG1_865 [Flavobacteriaceae bacterium FS1-H7996/R]